MIKYTTRNGTEYRLELKDTGLYGWVGTGVLPQRIKSLFLTKPDALSAIKFYDNFILKQDKEYLRFKTMTKKAELLAFAEDKGVDIPEDVVHPTSIKKIISEQLGV